MASERARSRCVSRRAGRELTHRDVPSAAALRPSSVVASFQVTNGTALLDGERPGPVDGAGLLGQQAALDVDARLAQERGSPDRDRVGVGLREHDADHTGVDEGPGARSGAAGVVAGLQRHDGRGTAGPVTGPGQGVHLGVRRAGAPVEPLGDLSAGRVEQHAADPWVGAEGDARRAGQLEGAHHRGALGAAGGHRVPSRPCRRTRGVEKDRRAGSPAVLRALPIRTFTVGPGVPPGQPAAGCSRVADFHRRLGITPTPEHASCSLVSATSLPHLAHRGYVRSATRSAAAPGATRRRPRSPGATRSSRSGRRP